MPRFDRRRVILAAAVLTPPVLLGALSSAVTFLGLAALDIPDLGARQAFKEDAELLDIVLFIVLAIGTFIALTVPEEPLKGLHGYTLGVLLLLVAAVRWDWSFGLSTAAAQIGLGIALWGLGWVLVSLHAIGLLRTLPHRRWVFVTGAIATYLAVATFTAVALGEAWGLAAVADLFAILALLAAVLVYVNREHMAEWGYRRLQDVHLPKEDLKRSILVPVYGLALFGLIGAAFVHHFDYGHLAPGHYLTLFGSTVPAVLLFGAVMERAGRRALLYTIPVLVGFVFVVQAAVDTPWPIMVLEGALLGTLLYLFQYFVEVSRVLGRTVVFAITMGAVAAMGAGGSFVAQFQGLTGIAQEQLLILQLAGLLLVFALAPLVPDTVPRVTEEEEIADYLEMARRVQEESSG